MIPSTRLVGLRTRASLLLALAGLASACAKPSVSADGSASSVVSAGPSVSGAPASAKPTTTALTSPPSASSIAAAEPAPPAGALDGGADAGIAAAPTKPEEPLPPLVADNQVKPIEGTPEELTSRAKGLFEAIVKDEPALGDPFWFPKEPFIPLKDVKGPDRYWDNLHRAYAVDIHKAHKKRKSWDGAVFSDFKVGSTPKWVKPGEEANKIGYYRSFHGKIRYELEGKTYSIDVHTVITWQGRWYVTHLGKFKK